MRFECSVGLVRLRTPYIRGCETKPKAWLRGLGCASNRQTAKPNLHRANVRMFGKGVRR